MLICKGEGAGEVVVFSSKRWDRRSSKALMGPQPLVMMLK